jgi:hypothetical protein
MGEEWSGIQGKEKKGGHMNKGNKKKGWFREFREGATEAHYY